MSWTYDATDLSTSTATGRLNAVRLLVGDTDVSDQQVQDEEIDFALSLTNDNIYSAGSWIAGIIYSKYARLVNTELDSAIAADYSDLAENYKSLAAELKQKEVMYSGGKLKFYAGGISKTQIETVRQNTDRPTAQFRMDRFRYPQDDYVDYEYHD